MAAAALLQKLLSALLGLLGALHDKSTVRGRFLLVLLAVCGGDLTTHNVLPHVILGVEVEKFADLVDTLWPQAHRPGLIRESWNGLVTLLHHDKVEHREVVGHDASTNGLALHLTSATLPVALAALLQQKTNTVGGQDTLHHGETLLVVSARDLEAVALELLTERIGIDFLGHPLVEERQQHAIFIDHDTLLLARFGARDVELHEQGIPC